MATECAICGRRTILMLAMEPGPDGKPWVLCSPCWREGVAVRKPDDEEAE